MADCDGFIGTRESPQKSRRRAHYKAAAAWDVRGREVNREMNHIGAGLVCMSA